MRTIVLGDIHGLNSWKSAIEKSQPSRVIFIGDYFDSFDISGVEQIDNFKQIIRYKEDNPQIEVVLLIGNHDHHYFPEIGYDGTSGFQSKISPSITRVLDENRHHLQMAYSFENFLFTHAGVSPVFMDEVFGENKWSVETVASDVNEVWKYKPLAFSFNGFEASGDNTCQTPIWIRPRSLMSANKHHPKGLKKDYVQIVGHTSMKRLDIIGSNKATNGRYFFIDTLDTSGEYLVIENEGLGVESVK